MRSSNWGFFFLFFFFFFAFASSAALEGISSSSSLSSTFSTFLLLFFVYYSLTSSLTLLLLLAFFYPFLPFFPSSSFSSFQSSRIYKFAVPALSIPCTWLFVTVFEMTSIMQSANSSFATYVIGLNFEGSMFTTISVRLPSSLKTVFYIDDALISSSSKFFISLGFSAVGMFTLMSISARCM